MPPPKMGEDKYQVQEYRWNMVFGRVGWVWRHKEDKLAELDIGNYDQDQHSVQSDDYKRYFD